MINLEINVREFILLALGIYLLAQSEPNRKETLALYEKIFEQANKRSEGIIP